MDRKENEEMEFTLTPNPIFPSQKKTPINSSPSYPVISFSQQNPVSSLSALGLSTVTSPMMSSSSNSIHLISTLNSDSDSIYPKSDFVSMDSFFSGPMTVKDPKGTTFKLYKDCPTKLPSEFKRRIDLAVVKINKILGINLAVLHLLPKSVSFILSSGTDTTWSITLWHDDPSKAKALKDKVKQSGRMEERDISFPFANKFGAIIG